MNVHKYQLWVNKTCVIGLTIEKIGAGGKKRRVAMYDTPWVLLRV
jgi:hypothetical protein